MGLSVVKGFRYKINYDHSEINYPIRFETDIWLGITWKKDAYFIANSICDFLNYIVFLSVNLGIDVHLLIRLKRTLDEKMKKFHNDIPKKPIKVSKDNKDKSKKKKKKEKEKDDAMNKAIKMVVLNTSLAILFKIPLSFMPIVHVIAEFYFKKSQFSELVPSLELFLGNLYNSGLSDVIPDVADLLYTISISIQLFIYIHFDKKIRTAFEIKTHLIK